MVFPQPHPRLIIANKMAHVGRKIGQRTYPIVMPVAAAMAGTPVAQPWPLRQDEGGSHNADGSAKYDLFLGNTTVGKLGGGSSATDSGSNLACTRWPDGRLDNRPHP